VETTPLFLSDEQVLGYHSAQIRDFGGQAGIADVGLLSSALAAPQNLYLYDDNATLCDIAAAYGFHLTKNHCFIDGNKRTALQAALAFLRLNGVDVATSDETLYEWMMELAQDVMSAKQFSDTLLLHAARRGGLTMFIWRFFHRV
jgi:death-on-curing protein